MKAKKIFKMKKQENNFAYIDGANLHKGIESSGWKLDYRKFRVWLLEKYGVKKAYIFIGLIPKYSDLYKYLQECGYTLVFKEVVYDSDGDYAGLVKFLQKKHKLFAILSPRNTEKCSILLKRTGAKISYINDQRSNLELSQKEKAPDGDRTP